jgi:ribose 5-phosphate isomerase B
MNKKKIITDAHITEAWKQGVKAIEIDKSTIITPQARDSAKIKDIVFNYATESIIGTRAQKTCFSIALGADHISFKCKEILKKFLLDNRHSVSDLGPFSEEPIDLSNIVLKVALAVKENRVDYGIILDETGISSSIMANKIPGIRAVTCVNEISAKYSREQNDANVLTLGSKIIGEELRKSIITAFLTAKFCEDCSDNPEKINEIETKLLQQPTPRKDFIL